MTWSHAILRSDNSIPADISVDFERSDCTTNSDKPADISTATDIYVNVSRPGLKPTDTVRVVLANYADFKGNSNSQLPPSTSTNASITVDLAYQPDGHFSAKLSQDFLLNSNSYGGITTTRQDIAVVIDGEWQTDPAQPQQKTDPSVLKNFHTDMYGAASGDWGRSGNKVCE